MINLVLPDRELCEGQFWVELAAMIANMKPGDSFTVERHAQNPCQFTLTKKMQEAPDADIGRR